MFQNDKISIVEKAVDQIRKLEEYKKELERRMNALEAKSTEIRFSLQEPLSGMDSMVESLQCLKSMGTKLKTVQANFSPHEFSATMNIETQVYAQFFFFPAFGLLLLLRFLRSLHFPCYTFLIELVALKLNNI